MGSGGTDVTIENGGSKQLTLQDSPGTWPLSTMTGTDRDGARLTR